MLNKPSMGNSASEESTENDGPLRHQLEVVPRAVSQQPEDVPQSQPKPSQTFDSIASTDGIGDNIPPRAISRSPTPDVPASVLDKDDHGTATCTSSNKLPPSRPRRQCRDKKVAMVMQDRARAIILTRSSAKRASDKAKLLKKPKNRLTESQGGVVGRKRDEGKKSTAEISPSFTKQSPLIIRSTCPSFPDKPSC